MSVVSDMTDVCRLCLQKNNLVSIFKKNYQGPDNMKDIIQITTGVQICTKDCISQKICEQCCRISTKMYQFRLKSQENDQKLKDQWRQYLKMSHLNINSKPLVKPGPMGETKPDSKSPVNPESKSPVNPESKSPVNPESKSPVNPESKPAVKPELKQSSKPESKPLVQPELKPSPKPESKPAVRPESKPAVKPELKPSPKPETKPAVKPELKPSPKPETKPAVKPESKPSPKLEPKPAVKPESKSMVKSELKSVAKSEIQLEAKPVIKSEVKLEGQMKKPIIHPSVVQLYAVHNDIKLPSIVLKCDLLPYVSMRMDEVENYYRKRNINMQEHIRYALKAYRKCVAPTQKSVELDKDKISDNKTEDTSKKTKYTDIDEKSQKDTSDNRNISEITHKVNNSTDTTSNLNAENTKKRKIPLCNSPIPEKKPTFTESLGLTPTKIKEVPLLICDICNSVQYYPKDMKKHRLKHLVCQFCKIRFKNMELKDKHIEKFCFIKNTMSNLPTVYLKKIELNLKIRKKYAPAFSEFSPIPGLEIAQEPPPQSSSIVAIKKASNIIDLSSDDELTKIKAEPHVSVQKNNDSNINMSSSIVKPDIIIKNFNFLNNIDPKATDMEVFKQLLKQYTQYQVPVHKYIQTDLPEHKSINISQRDFTADLGNLKQQLHVFKIPVEINNGTPFQVFYNYAKRTKNNRKYCVWHDLQAIDVKSPVCPPLHIYKTIASKSNVSTNSAKDAPSTFTTSNANSVSNPTTISAPQNVSVSNPTTTFAPPNMTVLNPTTTFAPPNVTILNPTPTFSPPNVNVLNPTTTFAPPNVTLLNPTTTFAPPNVTILNSTTTFAPPNVTVYSTPTFSPQNLVVLNPTTTYGNQNLNVANPTNTFGNKNVSVVNPTTFANQNVGVANSLTTSTASSDQFNRSFNTTSPSNSTPVKVTQATVTFNPNNGTYAKGICLNLLSQNSTKNNNCPSTPLMQVNRPEYPTPVAHANVPIQVQHSAASVYNSSNGYVRNNNSSLKNPMLNSNNSTRSIHPKPQTQVTESPGQKVAPINNPQTITFSNPTTTVTVVGNTAPTTVPIMTTYPNSISNQATLPSYEDAINRVVPTLAAPPAQSVPGASNSNTNSTNTYPYTTAIAKQTVITANPSSLGPVPGTIRVKNLWDLK